MAIQRSNQVTLMDLARELNLSPGAVSHALNEKPSTIRVSAETSRRVRELATKLGYRPNQVARILRTGRSGIIGILVRYGFDQLLAQHLYYARQNAERIGMIPFVYEVNGTSEASTKLAIDQMLDAKVDALLVLRGEISIDTPIRVPFSLIGEPHEDAFPSYFVDKAGGFSLLAQHLVDQGYSRLALIVNKANSWSSVSAVNGVKQVVNATRRKGKTVSLSIKKIAIDMDGFIQVGVPQMHGIYGTGYLGMKEIIASGNLPEAVICSTDSWAQGALRACVESGLRVPQDIAIAGFNDEPSSATGVLPLTSIKQPLEKLHEAAFSDLRLALSGKKPPMNRSVMFPCELVVRESTRRNQPCETSHSDRPETVRRSLKA